LSTNTISESWDKKATVMLHHVAESEDQEGGFKAVTIIVVPDGVSITSSDPDSAESTLNYPLDGLSAFDFLDALPLRTHERWSEGTLAKFKQGNRMAVEVHRLGQGMKRKDEPHS
jgi:hypothetical protein